SSREVFIQALQGANRTVYLNVYEFASPALAHVLADTRARGVTVEVLLEGGPVGGITPEERCSCRIMNRSGIPIYLMQAGEGEHARYRFDHAKYIVIDGTSVFLTSENFKESGIPPAGTRGNRGWGVFIRDPRVAEYFTSVYRSDRAGADIEPYIPGESAACATGPGEAYTVQFFSAEFSGASVTPVLAPDTAALIASMISDARVSVDIEQAYITNTSAGTFNPYLAAAVGAARRGVTVRVLLDSYSYNVEDTEDNDEMAMTINDLAKREGLPLEARCADLPRSGIEKIHNKGVIVDRKLTLVSSINWNDNSPNFNREAGVIIDHPGAAAYYSLVFEDDWDAGSAPLGSEGMDFLKMAMLAAVILGLILLFILRRRW
ncbi:MAG: phospholipase D-like domain-containing protein, partial [Methanomicrobiales archaeon]|nr:phospholipase D-like domain-containing protein [Methanomicrobiales archaeon]